MIVDEIYRTGHVNFMGIELLVAPGVQVPRQETELLGHTALEAIRRLGLAQPRVIDMCCGTGNLACAIARHVHHAEVWACDIAERCVELAWRNIRRLGLTGRVSAQQGDLFFGLSGLALEDSVDAIVCNPPYISARRLEHERAGLLQFEPRLAFDGGPYGLSVHQRVTREALNFLRPGGVLLFEIGHGQERQVRALIERTRAYEDVRVVRDELGDARVLWAHRKPRCLAGNPGDGA